MKKMNYRHGILTIGVLLIGATMVWANWHSLLSSGKPDAAVRGTPSEHAELNAPPGAELRSEGGNPDLSGLSRLFGFNDGPHARIEGWAIQIGRVLMGLSLAAILSAMVAFRPEKTRALTHRNPFVAETQILLAVVAAAMMMIVGDSAARAFGIFAAVSVVRFRTSIRDPKEITILLISLGIGLATGVGRWDLAILFALFVMLVLRVLDRFEQTQVHRTMELKVKTRNVRNTAEALKTLFKANRLTVERRGLDREDSLQLGGKIVYRVDLSSSFNTDRLGDSILASDPENIDKVEWHQKKTPSYLYQ